MGYILCVDGFQWMFAPKGCGFLWVNPIHQQFIHPLITSHNYQMPFPDEFHTRVSTKTKIHMKGTLTNNVRSSRALLLDPPLLGTPPQILDQ